MTGSGDDDLDPADRIRAFAELHAATFGCTVDDLVDVLTRMLDTASSVGDRLDGMARGMLPPGRGRVSVSIAVCPLHGACRPGGYCPRCSRPKRRANRSGWSR